MSRFARISVVLVAVGCLAWTVWALACDGTQPSTDVDPTASSSIEAVDSDTLAARYHYRGRTKRFFDRAKGRRREVEPAEEVQVAARYHLRNRTEKFFDRATDVKVAARYHLRGRTASFFGRTVV